MSTGKAEFAAYDAETAVGKGEDQAAYLAAVAADKASAVDKIKGQIEGLRERLAEAKTEQRDAVAAARAAQEGGAE